MPRDLVVFGEDWGGLPSSTQHLVKRLALGRRIVYVNSIGMRRPRLDRADLGRAARKLGAVLGFIPRSSGPKAPPEPIPPGMIVVPPLAIPWPGNPVASWLNRHLLGRSLRRALAAERITAPVLWLALPTAVDVLGALGERGVIYYCADDYAAMAGVDHVPVSRMERDLVRRADRVLAVSPDLVAKFPAEKTILLPHGADIALFSQPAPRPADLPPGKVAGFYGSISEWLDQRLLAETARRLADWQFVLIGDVRIGIERLSGIGNIRFLGKRPHAALPGYAQHWDVSLLPFLDTGQIRASNPLKLREYMAAGRPIVATDFPALRPYRDHLEIACGADDFSAAIRRAAAEAPERRAQRQARVAGETWEARAAEAAAVIDGL